MSKLDDILVPIKYTDGFSADEAEFEMSRNPSLQQDKQKIKDLMLELISEDEIRPSGGPKRNGIEQGLRRTRNKLRAELRKKVEEL